MRDKKLTENFRLKEFIDTPTMPEHGRRACWEALTPEVVHNLTRIATLLQVIRDYYDKPMTVTSGFRPVHWEILQGRSGTSQHTTGLAADFCIPGVPVDTILDYINKAFRKGGRAISKKGNFVHLDCRPTFASWEY